MNNNTDIVFVLQGLNETQTNRHIYFAFALVSYLLTIFVNLTLFVTIFLEKMFHEPMYLFLCIMCLNGLYGASSFYPKLLHDLLSEVPVISYNGCIAQIFVVYSYIFYEFSCLTVMAYDRYVAICKPLHYHAIMTQRAAMRLLILTWVFTLFEIVVGVVLTSRLPLCGTMHLQTLYCTNWEVVKLSCIDTTINNLYGFILIVSHVSQTLLIIVSYVRIVRAALRSRDDRKKFMQTCLPHLVTLVYFLLALLFDVLNARFGSKNERLRPLRNIMAAEFLVVPPLLNPIIYGLNLHQIRRRVAHMFTHKIHALH